jgi:hypothetical protein
MRRIAAALGRVGLTLFLAVGAAGAVAFIAGLAALLGR